jgi:hypothetical protein
MLVPKPRASTPSHGSVAQSVEHRTFNPLVEGSIPSRPTISAFRPPGLGCWMFAALSQLRTQPNPGVGHPAFRNSLPGSDGLRVRGVLAFGQVAVAVSVQRREVSG